MERKAAPMIYIQNNENEMKEILAKSLKTLILIGFPAFR